MPHRHLDVSVTVSRRRPCDRPLSSPVVPAVPKSELHAKSEARAFACFPCPRLLGVFLGNFGRLAVGAPATVALPLPVPYPSESRYRKYGFEWAVPVVTPLASGFESESRRVRPSPRRARGPDWRP